MKSSFEVLKELGLTDAEVKIYLALLDLGESSTGPLIEDTGLQSSVVHRLIKECVHKGIVTVITKSGVKYYTAVAPTQLVQVIEDKRTKLEAVIPELQSRFDYQKPNHSVDMFVGKRSIFTFLNNLVVNANEKELYYSFTLVDPHTDDDVVLFYKKHNLLRNEKKLRVKVLGHTRVRKIFESYYDAKLLKKANIRYTSYELPQGLIMFKNKVMFLNWEDEPYLVVIENKHMFDQYSSFFEKLYVKAKS